MLPPPTWSPSRPCPSFLPPPPPALLWVLVLSCSSRSTTAGGGCGSCPWPTHGCPSPAGLPSPTPDDHGSRSTRTLPPGCGCCGRPQALRTHPEDWGSWAFSRHLQEDSEARLPWLETWTHQGCLPGRGQGCPGEAGSAHLPASRMGPLHPPSWSLRLGPCPMESLGILHCLYFCGGPGPTFSWLHLPMEQSGRGLTWRSELPWVGGCYCGQCPWTVMGCRTSQH